MDWERVDIQKEIALGEDSSRQFKEKIEHTFKLAEEFCAFSNSGGGIIFVGVRDDGTIADFHGRIFRDITN
jgi:ATP-dependent DNA helicase RecG